MSDSVDPGPDAALRAKGLKTAPNLDVNLLKQILPPIWIGLITCRESLQRSSVIRYRVFPKFIDRIQRNSYVSKQIVTRKLRFLTRALTKLSR